MSPPHPIARLALANGALYEGTGFGAVGRSVCSFGEVVFNTALTGYQESLTDPSYLGQILVQTTPMIGNTGANPGDAESVGVCVAGFVVHELAGHHSNYRATESLGASLDAAGVLGISGIDTRALTRVLRSRGVVSGVVSDDCSISDVELVHRARNAPSMQGQNLAARAGVDRETAWTGSLGEWSTEAREAVDSRPVVLALDCGAKQNILRHLTDRGVEVRLAPLDTSAEEIAGRFVAGEIQGLFISNGPGDPEAVERTVHELGLLLCDSRTKAMPIFGICLGHQVLALACGAKAFKLKFGHRGANQPVHDLEGGRIEITSQNHGFAVDPETLPAHAEATHIHLNDGTLAGFRLIDRPVFGVQYHPEGSPGPHDSEKLFDRFADQLFACMVF